MVRRLRQLLRDLGIAARKSAQDAVVRTAVVIIATAWIPACGSAPGGVLHGPENDLAFGPVPPSWRRVDVDDAPLTYRDDQLGATAAVNARCGKDADDVPLEALRQHLFLHFTDRETLSEEKLSMDGREALKTVAQARLDGVKKSFVVYVLKKDGCVYDFLYITAPETLETGRPRFERFVAGFRTIAR